MTGETGGTTRPPRGRGTAAKIVVALLTRRENVASAESLTGGVIGAC